MDEDKKNEEPDFSAFADWHVTKQKYLWPIAKENRELTDYQKQIVSRNAKLLLNRDKWRKHVAYFEIELAKILDKEVRKKKRSEFHIHFDKYDFSQENNNFTNYYFPCSVTFQNAQFKTGSTSFDFAQFLEGDVSFEDVRFGRGSTSFFNTKFGEGTVFFDDAIFGEGFVYFEKVQFGKGDVYFDGLQLDKASIYFDKNIIEGSFFIRNVIFPKEVIFHNLIFKGPVFSSGCIFLQTPNFRNTNFERPIEIANMEVPSVRMNHSWLSPKAANEEDVHKYRKLKSMAQDAHDHIMEGYFFAQEMRAKRGVEITSFGELLLNQLYYVFSNYGQSYWRPLIGLFGSFYLFSIIYKLIMFPHLKGFDAGLVALDYSLRQTLPFVGSLLRFSPRPENHQSWFLESLGDIGKQGSTLEIMAYIGLVQSILGLILFFLLALGLRNKFRMK